ncbi:16070_t:CDS:2, partial [Racocetra persica]
MYIISKKESYTEKELDNFESKVILLKKSKNLPHTKLTEGLLQIIFVLDTFLNTSSQDSESDDFCIIVYETVHLNNGEILRNSEDFQSKKWFSNVSVTSAEDQNESVD